MEKYLPNLFYLCVFFTFFELAAGQSFCGMEASLLLLGGAAVISFPKLWQRRNRVWNLSEYWLFWAFGFYLLLDFLGALAPASWELSWEKYRVVALMAFLTLLAVLLLDSQEKLDRLFGVLALAAGTAAVLSVFNRMGMGLFPVEYDLRLSLRRDYNMFAVTILLGWCGGAFLQLRKCSPKNRAILWLSTVVCIPAVLLSGSRRGVLLLIPIGLLIAGVALLQGWKNGKFLWTLGGLILCLGMAAAVSFGLERLLHQLPEQSAFPQGEETSVSQRYETISEGSFFSKRRILWRIAWVNI